MFLALLIGSAVAISDPPCAPSMGTGFVRGVLLDTASKPVDNAHLELWTRPQDSSEPTARGWHQRSEVSTPAHGKFEIGRVEPGAWILVARFEGNTSQEFIIQRFTLAAGETKDLGELKPAGTEHSFRLSLRDSIGVDVTSLITVSDGSARSKLVRFDLVHAATVDDPPLGWSFVRPCGALITVRGLDALAGAWELQPRTVESLLLPPELRIQGGTWPIVEMGGKSRDPVSIDLPLATARIVRFDFETLEDEAIAEVRRLRGEVKQPPEGASDDDSPVRLAAVPEDGSTRIFHVHFRGSSSDPNEISLTPGIYRVYAIHSFGQILESDELWGITIQTVEIPPGDGVEQVHIAFRRGISVHGKARVTSAFKDPRERRALSAHLTALPARRALLPSEEPESMDIDVPLKEDGSFQFFNLPATQSFTIGLARASEQQQRTFLVPTKDADVGELVFD